MKIILTVSGDEVKVDNRFYPILAQKKWYTVKSAKGRTKYARTYHKGEHLYMHRLLMQEPEGMVIDHIDGDGLNNQRWNLQVVTLEENTRRIAILREAREAYDQWKRDESLQGQVNRPITGKSRNYKSAIFQWFMVAEEGLEPPTRGL